jgi:argonaute-like protein implicated in RNA metabolism and viral defense
MCCIATEVNNGCTAIWNTSEKLAHCYFSWIVCFQKETNTRILDNLEEKENIAFQKRKQ